MLIRAGRLARLVPIFAVLAFAALPATAANAALVFSPATPLSFGDTTAGMQTNDQTLMLTNTSTTSPVNLFTPLTVSGPLGMVVRAWELGGVGMAVCPLSFDDLGGVGACVVGCPGTADRDVFSVRARS